MLPHKNKLAIMFRLGNKDLTHENQMIYNLQLSYITDQVENHQG